MISLGLTSYFFTIPEIPQAIAIVNQAIVDFWKSCNGERKVTDLVEVFAQQTGLQRKQVEKEVMQLLQQLREGGLIAIAGQPDTPNVEFKK